MAKYRFVHLSDIHFGQEQKDGSTAIHDDIRDQLLKDCAIEKDKSGNANGVDRKSTRLNSSHIPLSRMPSSA